MNLTEIQRLTERLSKARAELTEVIDRLQLQQGALMQKAMPEIRRCIGDAAQRHAILFTAIDESRDLFEKPKTQIFHGIKVGLRKGAGGLSWEMEDEDLVRRIRKMFPDDAADPYLHITEKPNREALSQLSGDELKKLGCTVEKTGNIVMIKPVDGAVDKIVNALLKSAIDETQKEGT